MRLPFAPSACALLLLGCGHTFVSRSPKIFSSRSVNTTLDRLHLGGFGHAEIELRVAGLEGTVFRAAKLNPTAARPCAKGNEFASVEKNGTLELQGPLSIAGSHRLFLKFVPPRTPARNPLVLDLEFADERGPVCIRIPLFAGKLARARPSRVGAAL